MTRKERTAAALSLKVVDRLPTQVNFTKATRERFARLLAIAPASLDERLDNHLCRVDVDSRETGADGLLYDMWGVGFSTQAEGYLVEYYPLRDSASGSYTWPDVSRLDFTPVARAVRDERDGLDRFVVPNQGFSLFERAWSLYGMEELLVDLHLEEAKVEALLESITERQIALAEAYVAAGVDGGYFGDDLGSQTGLLFAPDLWRRLFKPRMARMFAVYRDAGLPVILHSDGNIRDIIPDLIDIGLSCLNPCQPEVLPHDMLAREFGRDLAFYGGVSTQSILPYDDADAVRTACSRTVSDLAAAGTGLLFGPSHRLMNDIPDANLLVLAEFIDELGGDDAH